MRLNTPYNLNFARLSIKPNLEVLKEFQIKMRFEFIQAVYSMSSGISNSKEKGTSARF